MKTIASIHGKTLWTLKNNINWTWLLGMCQNSPYNLASFYQGVKDFSENEEWKDDYDKSQFKEFQASHKEMLNGEKSEVA